MIFSEKCFSVDGFNYETVPLKIIGQFNSVCPQSLIRSSKFRSVPCWSSKVVLFEVHFVHGRARVSRLKGAGSG